MSRARRTTLLLACLLALACVPPAAGLAADSSARTGGAAYKPPPAPPRKATFRNGKAIAPAGAPRAVKLIIKAANHLRRKPYKWGGGHSSWEDSGYDCSGTVSYVLHKAHLLSSPLDSSSFMSWGRGGKGRWVTVYTNPDHAFIVVAGLRFDTGWRDREMMSQQAGGSGPRWGRPRSTRGFRARHPKGL